MGGKKDRQREGVTQLISFSTELASCGHLLAFCSYPAHLLAQWHPELQWVTSGQPQSHTTFAKQLVPGHPLCPWPCLQLGKECNGDIETEGSVPVSEVS